MENNLNFIIEEYNLELNYATIKPYSPLFSNPLSAYPSFNLTLTTLDPNTDISVQIASSVQPIINSILANEKPIHSSVADYFSNSSLNSLITIPTSAIDLAFNNTITETVSTYNADTSTEPIDLSKLNITFIN
jgi:hypothetical protein